MKKGKSTNRREKWFRRLHRDNKLRDDITERDLHQSANWKREVTNDPEGSGWRDDAPSKNPNTRKKQRARPPTKAIGHGARSRKNLIREIELDRKLEEE